MKIFFDAVDHSMQNEESKMMKMKMDEGREAGR